MALGKRPDNFQPKSPVAKDADGKPVEEVGYRMEPGVGEHAGRFAVVRLGRTVNEDGSTAWTSREIVDYRENPQEAQIEVERLKRGGADVPPTSN